MLSDLDYPSKYILLKRSFFYEDYMKIDKFSAFWNKIT